MRTFSLSGGCRREFRVCCGERLLDVQGGRGSGVMEVGDEGAEALRVSVSDSGEGEDEGHEDGGPGEFVVGSDGEVSHRNRSECT